MEQKLWSVQLGEERKTHRFKVQTKPWREWSWLFEKLELLRRDPVFFTDTIERCLGRKTHPWKVPTHDTTDPFKMRGPEHRIPFAEGVPALKQPPRRVFFSLSLNTHRDCWNVIQESQDMSPGSWRYWQCCPCGTGFALEIYQWGCCGGRMLKHQWVLETKQCLAW